MPKSKLEKQTEAEARAQERAKRSHKDQVAHLDAVFGPGQGAAKERARLKSLLDGRSNSTQEESDQSDKPKKKARKSKQEEKA